jgi:hypothetical protein
MKPKYKMTALFLQCSWADEIDIETLTWVDRSWWKQYKKEVHDNEDLIFPYVWYIGTNQEIVFDSADEFFGCFEEHDVDDDEIKLLQRLCGGNKFIGQEIYFDDLLDY